MHISIAVGIRTYSKWSEYKNISHKVVCYKGWKRLSLSQMEEKVTQVI